DNVMVRNAAQGLYATGACAGTVVQDNSIYGGGGVGMYGVYLAGARGLVLGTEGLGNDIAGTTQGLFAFGTLTGTTITGNLIEQNQTGIVLLGAKSLAIAAGNRIVSNSAWGLYASGDCALTTVKGSTFQANKSGVYMDAVLGMTVGTETAGEGNTISANQFGLFAIGVSTGTSVLGNTISGNTTNITVDATAAATGTFQAV
ncbi:MAG: NosD domain-containing protein, partial [Planctomycetaceae bacterium]